MLNITNKEIIRWFYKLIVPVDKLEQPLKFDN